MEGFTSIKRLIRKQVDAWGIVYTCWFYIASTCAMTLFTLLILFI